MSTQSIASGIIRAGAVAQGIGQAVSSLAGLLEGGPMTPLPGGVNIGGVDLYDFEIPEMMPWGSDEELHEHRLPGGAKLLQLMGAAYKPIRFSGEMIGPNAAVRAQLLEQLVWAEKLTTLCFGSFQYTGIVRSFSADYRTPFWMGRYEIDFETLPDNVAAGDAIDDPDNADPSTAANLALSNSAGDVDPLTDSVGLDAANMATLPYALGSAAMLMLPTGGAVPWLGLADASVAGSVTSASALALGSLVTLGMGNSGAAMSLAASNAPSGDLLDVADLPGAMVASGIQAGLVSAGYAAAFAQNMLTSARVPSPVDGWTPLTVSSQAGAF